MLICYDMVMPESSRSLALNGADVIFVSTMGGAVTTGDEGLNLAAFRTRAADNYVYLVIAMRSGAMIVSPQGAVLSEVKQSGGIAMADIDPFGGREGGDALNSQRDMRARLSCLGKHGALRRHDHCATPHRNHEVDVIVRRARAEGSQVEALIARGHGSAHGR